MALVVDSERQAAYLKALRDNNRSLIQPFVAGKLALLDDLVERELGLLSEEGFVTEKEFFGAEGELTGAQKVENPRANPVFRSLDLLGVNAREQLATPKSASEAKKDDAISSAGGLLERLLDFRRPGAAAIAERESDE